MRIFLAIFPPKEILATFNKIQAQLKPFGKYLKFTKPQTIHITLRFLGRDVSKESLQMILLILSDKLSGFGQFNLRIKEIRFGFPLRRWPRVLYISVMKNENLDKITSSLNKSFERLQLDDIEQYRHAGDPVHHFTLARSRNTLNKTAIKNIRQTLEKIQLWEGLRIKEIQLIESRLDTKGPKYKVLRSYKLC